MFFSAWWKANIFFSISYSVKKGKKKKLFAFHIFKSFRVSSEDLYQLIQMDTEQIQTHTQTYTLTNMHTQTKTHSIHSENKNTHTYKTPIISSLSHTHNPYHLPSQKPIHIHYKTSHLTNTPSPLALTHTSQLIEDTADRIATHLQWRQTYPFRRWNERARIPRLTCLVSGEGGSRGRERGKGEGEGLWWWWGEGGRRLAGRNVILFFVVVL